MYAAPALCLLVLLSPFLQAQDDRTPRDRRSWDNLATLHAGQKVQVTTKGARKWKGSFLAVTRDSISIHSENRDIEILRGEVRTVKRKSAAVRIRHALIGVGIGAAVGAAISIPNINEGYAAYGAVAASVLILAGATVVGAVLPAYSKVYEAGP
jgi:hypothetical protein